MARTTCRRSRRDPGAATALSRDALLALDDERAMNLLRYWMPPLGLPAASTARLTDALRQLREVDDDHSMRVDHAGQCLRSYRGEVFWEAGDSADPVDETALESRAVSELVWRGESIWRLPQWRGTFVFTEVSADDPDAIAETVLARAPLTARPRSGGERMRVDSNAPGRTLKNLFQERGVPAWKRDVPLIFTGDELLFVPLLGVNREAAATTSDKARARAVRHFRIDWRPDLLIA